jgi:hypothetical protein
MRKKLILVVGIGSAVLLIVNAVLLVLSLVEGTDVWGPLLSMVAMGMVLGVMLAEYKRLSNDGRQ